MNVSRVCRVTLDACVLARDGRSIIVPRDALDNDREAIAVAIGWGSAITHILTAPAQGGEVITREVVRPEWADEAWVDAIERIEVVD